VLITEVHVITDQHCIIGTESSARGSANAGRRFAKEAIAGSSAQRHSSARSGAVSQARFIARHARVGLRLGVGDRHGRRAADDLCAVASCI
jgi:hypothetical protein